jgi:hypothetical protein
MTMLKNTQLSGKLITNSSCHGYSNQTKSQNYPKIVLDLFI